MPRGHAAAQVICRRVPIAAARIRSQVRSCGISDGQSVTGVGYLQVPRFPC
jgi:hypothetical protein